MPGQCGAQLGFKVITGLACIKEACEEQAKSIKHPKEGLHLQASSSLKTSKNTTPKISHDRHISARLRPRWAALAAAGLASKRQAAASPGGGEQVKPETTGVSQTSF